MEKDRNKTQFTKKLFDTVHYRHMCILLGYTRRAPTSGGTRWFETR